MNRRLCAELPALRHLDLCGIRLGKEEIRALVKAPWRKQLEQLKISEDCVGERGMELLIDRFGEDVIDDDE